MKIHHYNLRNLKCPLPVLKTKALLKQLKKNEQVMLYCTDPQTLQDIPSFCQARGYTLLEIKEIESEFHFFIEV